MGLGWQVNIVSGAASALPRTAFPALEILRGRRGTSRRSGNMSGFHGPFLIDQSKWNYLER